MKKLIVVLTVALILAMTSGCGRKETVPVSEVNIDGALYLCYITTNDAAGTISYNNCTKE